MVKYWKSLKIMTLGIESLNFAFYYGCFFTTVVICNMLLGFYYNYHPMMVKLAHTTTSYVTTIDQPWWYPFLTMVKGNFFSSVLTWRDFLPIHTRYDNQSSYPRALIKQLWWNWFLTQQFGPWAKSINTIPLGLGRSFFIFANSAHTKPLASIHVSKFSSLYFLQLHFFIDQD